MNRRTFLPAMGGWLATGGFLAGQSAQRWVQVADDFSRGSGGWLPGFSDYDFRQAGMKRLAEVRTLPEEAGRQGKGYFLQGLNNSDDLFAFLKKPLTVADGITPHAPRGTVRWPAR